MDITAILINNTPAITTCSSLHRSVLNYSHPAADSFVYVVTKAKNNKSQVILICGQQTAQQVANYAYRMPEELPRNSLLSYTALFILSVGHSHLKTQARGVCRATGFYRLILFGRSGKDHYIKMHREAATHFWDRINRVEMDW